MTAPKHDPRRLGFRDGRDDPAREPYRRTAEDVVEFGRWIFLDTVAREAPLVLTTLHAIPRRAGRMSESALTSWAVRWRLTDDWCLAYARAAWRIGRADPAIPRASAIAMMSEAAWEGATQPSVPRPLKHPQHFSWLVEFQCQPDGPITYARMATRDYAKVQTVQEAVQRLAGLLSLTLRPVRRGAPRKSPIS